MFEESKSKISLIIFSAAPLIVILLFIWSVVYSTDVPYIESEEGTSEVCVIEQVALTWARGFRSVNFQVCLTHKEFFYDGDHHLIPDHIKDEEFWRNLLEAQVEE